jgi:hypothetical protein
MLTEASIARTTIATIQRVRDPLKEILYIVLVPMSSILGLAAFSAWWSALVYFLAVIALATYAVQRQAKHHHVEPFDDRVFQHGTKNVHEGVVKAIDE